MSNEVVLKLSNLKTMEEKNKVFYDGLSQSYAEKKVPLVIEKALDTFKSDFTKEVKEDDYSKLFKIAKENDFIYLSLIRSVLKSFEKNSDLSFEDRKAFLNIVVNNAVKASIVTPALDDLPTYKEEFSNLYTRVASQKQTELSEIVDILNLKQALCDNSLKSIHEKTMLEYSLKREVLKKENKIK